MPARIVAATAASSQDGAIPPSDDASLEPFRALVRDKLFTCTMCGKCCTGAGEVWVTDAEAAAIADHLSISLSDFVKKYTLKQFRLTGYYMLKHLRDSQKSCVFLLPDNKCSIHSVRPGQCGTYPWWPELVTQEGWQDEKERCEGFDHEDAVALTAEEVESAARQLRESVVQEQRVQLALAQKIESRPKWKRYWDGK